MRHLVIVRAGSQSMHHHWLRADPLRTWDLGLSTFGSSVPTCYDAVFRVHVNGPKWPGLAATLDLVSQDIIDSYDYILLPDDDLVFRGSTLTQFFRICDSARLDLAQPSLSKDSFWSHPITLHDSRWLLRLTNFVEIMAPCFSSRALATCRRTFNMNSTGWGLDYLWPTLLSAKHKIGIIDSVIMTHPRPLGGPNYAHLADRRPRDEMNDLLTSCGIQPVSPRCIAAFPRKA